MSAPAFDLIGGPGPGEGDGLGEGADTVTVAAMPDIR